MSILFPTILTPERFLKHWIINIVLSDRKDLEELSSLGHFLKGSSATLGFSHVKDECEKIQHYGHKMDETGTVPEPDDAKSLANIQASVLAAKKAFKVVDRLMRSYYAKLEAV